MLEETYTLPTRCADSAASNRIAKCRGPFDQTFRAHLRSHQHDTVDSKRVAHQEPLVALAHSR